MMPIEIEIFFHTDETTKAKDLNYEWHLTDCEIRKQTFYTIDSIGIFIDDDEDKTEYGTIHSGGTSFESPMKYEELKKLLSK